MEIVFSKYQGAGNDFILINNLSGQYDDLTAENIQLLCDRKFGVGADGLIMINAHEKYDYEVDYYNADASKSFCGNGGRCATAFARTINQDLTAGTFLGYDGPHAYSFEGENIRISMIDVNQILDLKGSYELYTGSPHWVKGISNLAVFPVFEEGKRIRYSDHYEKHGINVNFFQVKGIDELEVRTYERGVEAETLACGTGVTACAIAYIYSLNKYGFQRVSTKTLGGQLFVEFNRIDEMEFNNVFLIGPAQKVFEGIFESKM